MKLKLQRLFRLKLNDFIKFLNKYLPFSFLNVLENLISSNPLDFGFKTINYFNILYIIYIYTYISSSWWLFNQGMLSKKVLLIFWNFILIFAFLCMSEGRSQKLILVTSAPQTRRWKSSTMNQPVPIRKSSISPNSIDRSKLWLVYSTLSYFRSKDSRIIFIYSFFG